MTTPLHLALLASTLLVAAGPAAVAQVDSPPYGDIILTDEEAILDFAADPDTVLRLFAAALEPDGITLPDELAQDTWNQVANLWFRTELQPFKDGAWTRFRLRVADFDDADDHLRAETLLTRMATLLDSWKGGGPVAAAEPAGADGQVVDSALQPQAVGADGGQVVVETDPTVIVVEPEVIYVPEIVTVYSYLPAWSFGWYACSPYSYGYGHYNSFGRYAHYGSYAYGSWNYGYCGYGWPYASWYGGFFGHHAFCSCAFCFSQVIVVKDDDCNDGSASGPGDVVDGNGDGDGTDPGGVGGGDGDTPGRGGRLPDVDGVAARNTPAVGRTGRTPIDDDGRTGPGLGSRDRDGDTGGGLAGAGDDVGYGRGGGRGGVAGPGDGPVGDDGGPVAGEPTRRPTVIARVPLGGDGTSRTPTVRRAPTRTVLSEGTRTPILRRPVTSGSSSGDRTGSVPGLSSPAPVPTPVSSPRASSSSSSSSATFTVRRSSSSSSARTATLPSPSQPRVSTPSTPSTPRIGGSSSPGMRGPLSLPGSTSGGSRSGPSISSRSAPTSSRGAGTSTYGSGSSRIGTVSGITSTGASVTGSRSAGRGRP